ncbi:MAG: hypothetical protein V8T51_03660 [Senegalimassilia faecalis]
MQIKLTISRNLTILQGNSATGKTTLIELIAAYDELGEDSGAFVNCAAPCKVLAGRNWMHDLATIENSIVFVDEDNAFMRTYEFAHAARHSSNYYVLVARESLPQLPYSVDEIYGLKHQPIDHEISRVFAHICFNIPRLWRRLFRWLKTGCGCCRG